MYTGLGILPVIISQAASLLVPAIESLFTSNTSSYSFPTAKTMIDNWAGVVNLDPTMVTANAQWAWANIRCVAGDPSAVEEMAAALQLFPVQRLGFQAFRMTPNGPVPDGVSNPCTVTYPQAVQYALAAVRVLTTRRAQPNTGLYSGELPTPLPPIPVPVIAPSATPSVLNATVGGIPVLYLGLGVAALLLVMRRR